MNYGNKDRLTYVSKLAGLEQGFKVACAGRFNTNGSIIYKQGSVSVARTATGTYKITHNLNTTAYGVIGCGMRTDGWPVIIGVKEQYTNYCVIVCNEGEGGYDDCTVNFILFKF